MTTSEEIDESMMSLSGIESDSRAAMFARWFLIRLRRNLSIFFVFNQRRSDDLVQLRLVKNGQPIDCMGMVIGKSTVYVSFLLESCSSPLIRPIVV